jgi:membrane AbrB-like protein
MPAKTPSVDRRVVVFRWIVLLVASVIFGGGLEHLHLPAALLLGPMAAAVLLSTSGRAVRVAPPIFLLAQAVVGTMIARSMPPAVFIEIGKIWPIILFGVVFVVGLANGLGWLIARRGVLPGTTAVWGSSPGAATAMVIMSEAYGGDMRLVAMMQYVRVIMVASAASIVARLYIGGSLAEMPAIVWFPPIHWQAFAETMAVIAAGLVLSRLLRLATGAMVIPMGLAIGLQFFGLIEIELPPWLLAASYAIVGWSIGLRFTPAILSYAARALPTIIGSILVLIAVCAVFGMVLTRFAGVDPLSAYLASSPGGADAMAIISASVNVDMPFVMAMQTMRFILVLLTGPMVARFIASRLPASRPEA